ncbi:MAG: NAD(P)H-dependent oxidoreductase [Spartobacteria bacterium AMD-G4]|jgi:nitroreductase|nr:MAG: NAD(P)H-dependent oxidoreductase [Spartobacteria bacterium AMD-G4]
MNPITTDQLLAAQAWRYATKQFDASKTIPAPVWQALEDSLVLSPSSYGLQPWQFFVVTNPDLRAKLRPHSWNQTQVTDASHLVVFAIPDKVDVPYMEKYVARIAEVRSVTIESLGFYRDMMMADVIAGPRQAWVNEWAARQVYIALGNFMTSAALVGVDTCPLEGIDPREYDAILDLPAKGFNTIVACAAGYRSADDKYATLPKVRFEKSDLVRHL